MTIIFQATIPLEVMSQNERDITHWSKLAKTRKLWESWITVEYTRGGFKAQTQLKQRQVTLTCYRRRLCRDIANLVGGAKLTCDAIVNCNLLIDDCDTWAKFNYEQLLRGKHPSKKPCTVITIEEP